MMSSTTRWLGRAMAVAFVTTIAACADAPTAPGGTGSANPMIACTPDDCGGGGYVGPSTSDVIMRGFEDQGGYPTGEYYEIRHRFMVNGAEVYYYTSFIHGDAFATGDFPNGIDTGRQFPCVGEMVVNILHNEVYFGHVVSSEPVATIEVTSADNGKLVQFWNPMLQSMGYVRYTWAGCQ